MSEPTRDTTPNPAEKTDEHDAADEPSDGQVSEGPSGFRGAETSAGGADAVPDTPDVNPGCAAPIR